MSLSGRVWVVYRRAFNVGLERKWYELLAALDATRRRLDAGAELLDDATLREMAREAAASGREPGDVLADLLEARVSSTESGCTS